MPTTLALPAKSDPKVLGETLRSTTFIGDELGCYENFNIRLNAREWTRDERGRFVKNRLPYESVKKDVIACTSSGYTFTENGLTVDTLWWWDEDVVLYFRVRKNDKTLHEIININYKTDDGWQDFNEWLKSERADIEKEKEEMWHGSAW